MIKNKMNIYKQIDEDVNAGASFEQKWYESTIMALIMIRDKRIEPVRSHTLLLEICDGLHWVKLNLNVQLTQAYRDLLGRVFDACITIIQDYIANNDVESLTMVISSLRVVAEPYKNTESVK